MNDESSKHMSATRHADLVRRVLPEWRTIFDPPIQTTATTLQEAAGDGWNACLNQMRANLAAALASQPAEQPRGEKYPAVFTGRLLGKHVGLHGSVDSVEALEAYIDAAAKLYTAQPKPEQAGCAHTVPERSAARCDAPGCNCATWMPEGCAWDGVEPEQVVGDGVDEETTVRYCPECSHLGEVHSDCRDCCPDGSKARYIPVHIAEAAQRDFRASIAPRPAVATPAEMTDLRRALTALLVDHDNTHGPGACDCRPELENAGHTCSACLARIALASPSAGAVVPAAMTETSRVPDDFRNQAAGYRAGWNDFRGCVLAAAPEVKP